MNGNPNKENQRLALDAKAICGAIKMVLKWVWGKTIFGIIIYGLIMMFFGFLLGKYGGHI